MKMLARFPFLILLLASWLVAPATAGAQDVITDLNGTEVQGQVIEITPTQVLYRALDTDAALPPSVLDKKTLFMVRFANGTKEVFTTPQPAPALMAAPELGSGGGAPSATSGGAPMTPADLSRLGAQDALLYHNYSGAFWGTYAATLCLPLGGPLASGPLVGLGVSVVRPNAQRNMRLDPARLQYPEYVEGYERQAQRRKIGQAAKGYGAGVGTVIVVFIALVAAFSN